MKNGIFQLWFDIGLTVETKKGVRAIVIISDKSS